ncbi:hypothetical protein CC80DRAFT_428348 [Byssothecium circinans]|uniref:Copper transport protein n=1 Tax=Byssothecium circinans TaxID=147558 RepID=A0A6A5TAM6_9PLEO|nr:hypothetical protein CC80DRAFT_428348 [Byssothecium circinans]
MAMTFFTSTTTPLFSMAWTPTSSGQYAGTCIFLIIFATIFRSLLAIRLNFFEILAMVKRRRGDDQMILYNMEKQSGLRTWRASEAVMMAFLDVVIAGTGYLIMIVVMTMNVGYFLSILGGVFLGSLIFGRFMGRSAAH